MPFLDNEMNRGHIKTEAFRNSQSRRNLENPENEHDDDRLRDYYHSPADRRLALAVHSRLEQCQARHKYHIQLHQLRVYVEKTLKTMKTNSNIADWGIRKFKRIRSDECHMQPNALYPPKPAQNEPRGDQGLEGYIPKPDKTPNIRNFIYLDFYVEFDVEYHWYEDEQIYEGTIFTNSDEDRIYTFLESDFKDEFTEVLEEVVTEPETGLKKWFPDFSHKHDLKEHFDNAEKHGWADKRHLYTRGEDWLERKGSNKSFVLNIDNRKKLLKECHFDIYRANANIPDGVLVMHFDKWVVLDHKLNDVGMDGFGLRIWPKRKIYSKDAAQNSDVKQETMSNDTGSDKVKTENTTVPSGISTNIYQSSVELENVQASSIKKENTDRMYDRDSGVKCMPAAPIKKYVPNTIPDAFDILAKKVDDEIDRNSIIYLDAKAEETTESPCGKVFNMDDGFGMNADYYQRRGRHNLMSKFIVIWKWLRHQYNDQLGCLTDWFLIQLSYICCMKETDEKLKQRKQINLGCHEPDLEYKDFGIENEDNFGMYAVTLSKAIYQSFDLLSGIALVEPCAGFDKHCLMSDPCHYKNEFRYRDLLCELDNCQLYDLEHYKKLEQMEIDGMQIRQESINLKPKSTRKTVRNICNIFKTMIDFGNTERTSDPSDPWKHEDNNQPEYKIFGRIQKKPLTEYKKNHQPFFLPERYNGGDAFYKFLEDERCFDYRDELEERAFFLHSVILADAKQTELSRKILEGQRTIKVPTD